MILYGLICVTLCVTGQGSGDGDLDLLIRGGERSAYSLRISSGGIIMPLLFCLKYMDYCCLCNLYF